MKQHNLIDDDIKAFLDSLPIATYIKNIDGDFIFINKHCETLFGISCDEITGNSGEKIYAPGQFANACTSDALAFETGAITQRNEVIINAARHCEIPVQTQRRAAFCGSSDTPLLVCSMIDISSFKKIEESLRYSSEKLQGLFDLSPLGIALASMDGKFLEFNAEFCRITGYDAEELHALDYWDLTPKKYMEKELEQIASMKINGNYGPYEKEYIRKDGSTIPLSLSGILLKINEEESYIWSMVEDLSEKKKTKEYINFHANYDHLTGLANRRMFYDWLTQGIENAEWGSRSHALMVIDIDGFNRINDSLGHHRADLFLRESAARITATVGDAGMVGRLSGDEFAVFLPAFDDLRNVDAQALRLLQALSEAAIIDGEAALTTASIGIAVCPDDSCSADEMLRHAETAMFAAKASGGDRFSYFRESMQAEATKRSMIARELRKAIQLDQFSLYYQPIIEMRSGRVLKAEALLRWHHPEMGPISPADFIQIAEQTGSIGRVGQWVFENVVRQIGEWDRAGLPPIVIGINRSPVEFISDSANIDLWSAILEREAVSGDRIVVEVTEGVLAEFTPEVLDQLGQIRAMGMGLALDDFGTGYSSLVYLKKFDVDFIKIDRTFVQGIPADEDDLTICDAVIAMANRLGITVIAEGIETPQQYDALLDAGCEYGQGFLISKPISTTEFGDFLRRNAGTIIADMA